MTSPADPAIDALIRRFYAAFDNRAEAPVPSSAPLLALFSRRAVVAASAGTEVRVMSLSEFIDPRIELLTGGRLVDFHEWETSANTEVLGPLATRASRYAKEGTLDGHPYSGAGSKRFHLICQPEGWKILSVLWVDDPA